MTLQERFAKFQKSFPKADIQFKEWKEMTVSSFFNPNLTRLDMSVFPDGLTSFVWEGGALTNIQFAPEHINLEKVALMYTHVNAVVIPTEITKLTTLTIEGCPLVRFSLGGSVASIENLYLGCVHKDRVTLPAGMESLTTLQIDTTGQVNLPKDAEKVETLILNVGAEAEKVKVPNTWNNLEYLTVQGEAVSVLQVAQSAEKLATLKLSTNASTLALPRLPAVRKMTIDADSAETMVIPKSFGETIEAMELNAREATVLTLPSALKAISTLVVNMGDAELVIPKTDGNLNILAVRATNKDGLLGSVKIKDTDLGKLESLDLSVNEVKAPALPTATFLESLVVSVNTLAGNLPKELPRCTYLSVSGVAGITGEDFQLAADAFTMIQNAA